MTTKKPFDGITVDDHNTKPTIMKTYDFSKGGTDIVDQRMNFKKFSTKAKWNKLTNRVRYSWGSVPYFNQLGARKRYFTASDWLKYRTSPHQYRTLWTSQLVGRSRNFFDHVIVYWPMKSLIRPMKFKKRFHVLSTPPHRFYYVHYLLFTVEPF